MCKEEEIGARLERIEHRIKIRQHGCLKDEEWLLEEVLRLRAEIKKRKESAKFCIQLGRAMLKQTVEAVKHE